MHDYDGADPGAIVEYFCVVSAPTPGKRGRQLGSINQFGQAEGRRQIGGGDMDLTSMRRKRFTSRGFPVVAKSWDYQSRRGGICGKNQCGKASEVTAERRTRSSAEPRRSVALGSASRDDAKCTWRLESLYSRAFLPDGQCRNLEITLRSCTLHAAGERTELEYSMIPGSSNMWTFPSTLCPRPSRAPGCLRLRTHGVVLL